MAGIGFELRRLLKKKSLAGKIEAYAFAAIIGSGPWVVSIVAILVVGLLNISQRSSSSSSVDEFQVSVTYLIAASLILSGLLQLTFTRFMADRLYEGRSDLVLPNLFGALIVTFGTAGVSGWAALAWWFHESFFYRQCMLASFVTLCGIWIVVVFASAIKAFREILYVFVLGYSITIVASMGLRAYGLEGLLLGFLIGQACLFFALLALTIRQYPGSRMVSFAFLERRSIYSTLVCAGFLYNVGAWADKVVFWADPLTSVEVLGPLRASSVYDLPIFLSYLSLIPGMAVFLIRVETDFAAKCASFYRTITTGGTLADVVHAKRELVEAVQTSITTVVKVQGATTIFLLIIGPELLALSGISPLHRSLLNIDLLAAAVQLLLLVVLNVLFYLDQRLAALRLCLVFAVSNLLFSWLSLSLGPAFFGYGFAASVTLTLGMGLVDLSRKLAQLEYETFMLQPVAG
jgi:polysaccharide biosynthesis protein PelG